MIFDLNRLLLRILEDQTTEWHGIHGLSHWGRVHSNGMMIAADSGAKIEVVELFAFFHDSQRVNDGYDKDHGLRGAQYARLLRGDYFELSDEDFEVLYEACRDHTDVAFHDNVTIQTCFDSDRLDLGRVAIYPDRNRLGTEIARDPNTIAACHHRAERAIVPEIVSRIWHDQRGSP